MNNLTTSISGYLQRRPYKLSPSNASFGRCDFCSCHLWRVRTADEHCTIRTFSSRRTCRTCRTCDYCSIILFRRKSLHSEIGRYDFRNCQKYLARSLRLRNKKIKHKIVHLRRTYAFIGKIFKIKSLSFLFVISLNLLVRSRILNIKTRQKYMFKSKSVAW